MLMIHQRIDSLMQTIYTEFARGSSWVDVSTRLLLYPACIHHALSDFLAHVNQPSVKRGRDQQHMDSERIKPMSTIDQKYAELGGPGGMLGPPAGGETTINTPGGGTGQARRFAHGAIYWIDSPNVKSHMTSYPDVTFAPGDQVT